jgi:hypothetical protein
MQKNELDLYLTPYTNMNLKCMKELNGRTKNIKLLKENRGRAGGMVQMESTCLVSVRP